jgi:glycosyltransferase involved in cell wall biosynthesis
MVDGIIAITTVDRTEVNKARGTQNYINECLNALFNPYSDAFEVVVFDAGSASTNFIFEAVKSPLVKKVVGSDERLSIIKNTNRALAYIEKESDAKWAILLQDDVMLEPGVLSRLSTVLDAAPDSAVMLCLVTTKWGHFNFCRKPKSGYVRHPTSHWYPIWFSAFRRGVISDWLSSRHCADGLRENNGIDNYIGPWYATVGRIYVYTPSLGSLRGSVSAKKRSKEWLQAQQT